MIKHFQKTLIFLCTLFSAFAVSAQTPEVFLQKLHADYQLEKIFIHTDKQFYIAGDTIWLKAYILADDLPSDKSSRISISLVNDSSKAISQLILPVQASFATGNFFLPTKLPGGTYSLQAYTNYMGVRDKQSFYNRSFQVVNINDEKKTQEIAFIPKVSFFPEAGTIVEGLTNTIAIKCTDQFGYPANASGNILDNNGNEIFSFNTSHEGMGKIRLKPEGQQFYRARLQFENGTTADFNLPATKPSGLGLETAINAKDILLVLNEEKLANPAMRPAYMILSQHSMLVSKSTIPAQAVVNLKIPTTDLATGILQVTLFTEANQPVLERLFFINNDNYKINGTLNTVKFSNTAKGKNVLDFSVQDTFPSTFSVSVIDAAYDTSVVAENTIASDLLFAEELRGYVHNPAQYFENNTLITRRNADLVMMTNGWRRYNWESIMNNRLPVFPEVPLTYLNFSGTLRDNQGNAFKNGSINAMIKDKKTILGVVDIDVDDAGAFAVENFIIYDSFRVEVLKVRDASGKPINMSNLKMTLTHMPVKAGLTISPLATLKNRNTFSIPNERFAYYNEQGFRKEQTLQGVRVEATKRWEARNEVNDRYTKNTLFGSGEVRAYDFINEPLS